jgi:uncharacterized protein (DUF1786 family)
MSDDEERFKAMCEHASNEKDREKLNQLISEILAVLEANENGARREYPTK